MKIKFFTILSLSLFLSACSLKPTPTPPKNVFTSVKDAVNKQIAIKCEYTDNGHTTTTYIKGQTIRLVGNQQSAGIEGLIKNGQFYLWNTKDKKGMTLDLTKIQGAKMGNTNIKSVDDIVTELDNKKENCTVSTDNNSIFDLPSDINFSAAPDLFGSQR